MKSHQQKETSLIAGLPDDVALSCIARVPRRFHTVLRNVCGRWRDLISSEDWYAYRRNNRLSETWIYALCRDKSCRNQCYVLDPDSPNRSWKVIQELPSRCLRRLGMELQSIGKKLYLVGGCGWSQGPTCEAYSFDTSINSWKEATPLSIPRGFFACVMVSGKILAFGGFGVESVNCSWESLDPVEGTQELHLDEEIIADVDDSVVYDGKVYARREVPPTRQVLARDIENGGWRIEDGETVMFVYDGKVYVSREIPLTRQVLARDIENGSWRREDGEMAEGWKGPAVVVEGALYVLDQSSGARVMTWQKESKEWLMVGRLSQWVVSENCKLVGVGKRVFAVGKGLGTVVFNVDHVGNMGGRIMVSSSINGVGDRHVISCVAVSL